MEEGEKEEINIFLQIECNKRTCFYFEQILGKLHEFGNYSMVYGEKFVGESWAKKNALVGKNPDFDAN